MDFCSPFQFSSILQTCDATFLNDVILITVIQFNKSSVLVDALNSHIYNTFAAKPNEEL